MPPTKAAAGVLRETVRDQTTTARTSRLETNDARRAKELFETYFALPETLAR